MTTPASLSLTQTSRAIAGGELSPLELTGSVLERINSLDPWLEAYTCVFGEEALAVARRTEGELSTSGLRGPLHGVPVAVKDLYDVVGKPTLAGSRVREGHVAGADSEVVRRLRQGGAVIIGKTVTHEFASGVTSPPARNPWDSGRVPGGSSGGSGAAVAADLCLAATGTDTAGSIRIPAAANGVVGLKPTFGRVSMRGVVPLAWSLDHAGPLARTVLDAAVMLNALAGYDPASTYSLDEPVPDFTEGLDAGISGLRIGVIDRDQLGAIEPFVAEAMRDVASVFEGLGALVEEVKVSSLELAAPAHHTILCAEAGAYHQPTLRNAPERYRRGTRAFLQAGQLVPATAYIDAQRACQIVSEGLRTAFSRLDVLMCPTLPTVATALGTNKVEINGSEEDITQAYIRLSTPGNLAGLPALSMPCGFYSGLPLGLQLLGKPLDERTVLRVGYAYEQATEHHLQRPSFCM